MLQQLHLCELLHFAFYAGRSLFMPTPVIYDIIKENGEIKDIWELLFQNEGGGQTCYRRDPCIWRQ